MCRLSPHKTPPVSPEAAGILARRDLIRTSLTGGANMLVKHDLICISVDGGVEAIRAETNLSCAALTNFTNTRRVKREKNIPNRKHLKTSEKDYGNL